MEKQFPTLVDFFFIQLFFNWVARVQKFLSRSNVHAQSSSKLSSKMSPRCNESVAITESSSCSQNRPDGNVNECEDIKLVMGRLGLVCEQESEDKKLVFDDISTLFDENEPCLVEVKAAFSVFDQNNDGFIDENELRRVMSALGLKEWMELETCRSMISDYDANSDGRIDFCEFLNVVEKSFC